MRIGVGAVQATGMARRLGCFSFGRLGLCWCSRSDRIRVRSDAVGDDGERESRVFRKLCRGETW
jgi:hypothetical protein